ncbi:MAG: alcohol dehydrogenase catalytic domain-containing protein [Solirubrobacteraceae bacterium]|nr:alcohol dehydrogenase catalytic domain-containing protein [Patulibacter sp.]
MLLDSDILSVAITASGTPDVVRRQPATPGPGEMVVDVAACGICGSDLHMLSGGRLREGAVLGHEITGTVSAVGAGVPQRRVGTPVVVRPITPCERCATCRAGAPHLCRQARRVGVGLGSTPGGFAERVTVAASAPLPVPVGLDLVDATLAEPLAVALQAIAIADHALYLAAGADGIVVLGGGPIGLLTALALRSLGHDDVVLVEPGEGRAAHARALGLDVGMPEPGTARLIFECAGSPTATAAALDLAAPEATVILIGMLYEPVALPQLELILKQITVCGSFGYREETFRRAVGMLASGAVRAADVITDVRPLADLPAVIDELRRPGTSQVKAVIRP